ncbi:hypothetical protein SH2C18_25350 [Clostridium sediminicola]|uniref:hypothetical protein n=1 Tax=Clostridium sediminicola TaxID=3114879 RepID=UPI0031F20712
MRIALNIANNKDYSVITERMSIKEGVIATQIKKGNLEMIFDENIISKEEILDFIEELGFSIL